MGRTMSKPHPNSATVSSTLAYMRHEHPVFTTRPHSMATQKALFQLDPAGTLSVREYPVPAPGPGEILVEIRAAGLNPVDWKMEEFKFVKEYPAVIGIDAAGVVKVVGEGVTSFVVGDKVYVLYCWGTVERY